MNNQFFDNDMWLNLEKELTQFDDALGDKDWMPTSNSTPSNGEMKNDSLNEPNDKALAPQTYEQLIQQLSQEPPTSDQLRSRSRQERIEAVRQLYNRMPTILNANSIAKLHRVANTLYKAGHVKQATRLVTTAEKTINKSFTYLDDNDKYSKSLDVTSSNGEVHANVQITDKEDESAITKSFANVLEAVKFFLNHGEKED